MEEPGELNWDEALGDHPFLIIRPTRLFHCLECSPWMMLALLRDAWTWQAQLGAGWEREKAADVATWPSLPQPRVGWEWAINLMS